MQFIDPTHTFFYLCDELEIIMLKRDRRLTDCVRSLRIIQAAKDLEALVWYIPHLSFTIDMEQRIRMAKPDFNLIEYRLSDDELAGFDVWADVNKLTIPQIFAELATRGYKVSFTYVTGSQAWCVSITGTKDAKFNTGATLTTWADEAMEGLFMAYFKVSDIFQFGVWKTKTQSRRG